MKDFIYSIIGFALICCVVWLGLFVQDYMSPASAMKRQLGKLNYCTVKEDCKVLYGVCPLGCYIPVNKAEEGKAQALMASFETHCMYSCVPLKSIECVSNKCEVVTGL